MPSHDPDATEALKQLRRWKQSVTPNGEPDPDIDEALDTLAEANPRAMLHAIVALLDEQLDQDVIAPLAAGPLEDLLGAHGDALIDEVEKLSKEHPAFQHALGGVWQNNMSDAVWERILSAGPDQRW